MNDRAQSAIHHEGVCIGFVEQLRSGDWLALIPASLPLPYAGRSRLCGSYDGAVAWLMTEYATAA